MEVLVHHAEKVKQFYDAFNRGDISFIISNLHKDCIWEVMGQPDVPFAGIYHGPADVKGFFEKLNKLVEFKEMVPEHILDAGNNLVVATGHYKGTIRKTKKPFSSIFAMFDEFNDEGKVVHFRDCYDTLSIAKAFGK
jgi:uncharacterized protein